MQLQRMTIIEAVGWTGAALSLTAFSMNSMNIIGSQSVSYLLLNIFGCCFLIGYAFFKKAYASWVLNSIWLLMTLVALVKIYWLNSW
ncbi:MAG: hypothetical protein EOO15_17575 [Chitinophagaceae bacterium]|nr:MAG: hypothetical protein EOO15_17575 [Chitinophagaceae bacterium]